jgi:hypothetical protein
MPSEIDYGPLTLLVGKWQGDKGVDIAPEPEGKEINPYFETITFEAAGDVTNAELQTLAIVRYHQVVRRKSNNEVFHDQVGYWTWDEKNKMLAQSFAIPRGVAIVAEGKFDSSLDDSSEVVLEVQAQCGDESFGISQSKFMFTKAKTTAFRYKATVSGQEFRYSETTVLEIYGRNFDHTDLNVLTRVGDNKKL